MTTSEFTKKLQLDIKKLEVREKATGNVFDQLISKRIMLRRLEQLKANRSIEYRGFSVSVKENMTGSSAAAKAQGHYLVGQPIVFNKQTNIGWFDEIIDSKALNGANLNDVCFLVNHDQDMIPLARSKRNQMGSTMHITINNSGLNIRVDLDTENNPVSKSLFSAVRRGDISGMSFGFVVDKDSWENIESDHPTRCILSIKKVIEVSAVTYPAYNQTSIKIAKGE